MTVQDSIVALDRCCATALSAADALRLTVCEDVPAAADDPSGRRDALLPLPVEKAGDLAIEGVDLLRAAAGAVEELLAGEDGEAGDPRAAVTFVQARRLDLAGRMAHLSHPERLFALAGIVERRGGAWHGWWGSVLRGLDELTAALAELDAAIASCWRELSEGSRVHVASATVGRLRVGARSSLQTTGEER
jgi:hypothetical protein